MTYPPPQGPQYDPNAQYGPYDPNAVPGMGSPPPYAPEFQQPAWQQPQQPQPAPDPWAQPQAQPPQYTPQQPMSGPPMSGPPMPGAPVTAVPGGTQQWQQPGMPGQPGVPGQPWAPAPQPPKQRSAGALLLIILLVVVVLGGGTALVIGLSGKGSDNANPTPSASTAPTASPTPSTSPTKAPPAPGAKLTAAELFDKDWNFRLGEVHFEATKRRSWDHASCNDSAATDKSKNAFRDNDCEYAVEGAFDTADGVRLACQIMVFADEGAADKAAEDLDINDIMFENDSYLSDFKVGLGQVGAIGKYVIASVGTSADDGARDDVKSVVGYFHTDYKTGLLFR